MKSLIVLLAVCSLGYVVDHWQELAQKHSLVASAEAPELIIYSSKADPACVRLEGALKKQGIRYVRRDMTVEANQLELTDKMVRVGKIKGSIQIPAADIDGVMYEGVTIEEIVHKMQ